MSDIDKRSSDLRAAGDCDASTNGPDAILISHLVGFEYELPQIDRANIEILASILTNMVDTLERLTDRDWQDRWELIALSHRAAVIVACLRNHLRLRVPPRNLLKSFCRKISRSAAELKADNVADKFEWITNILDLGGSIDDIFTFIVSDRFRINSYDAADIYSLCIDLYNQHIKKNYETSYDFNAQAFLIDEGVPPELASNLIEIAELTQREITAETLSPLVSVFLLTRHYLENNTAPPLQLDSLVPKERFANRPVDTDPISFLNQYWGDAIQAGITQKRVSEIDPDLLPGVKAHERKLKEEGKRVPKFKWPRKGSRLEEALGGLPEGREFIEREREAGRKRAAASYARRKATHS